MHTVYKALENNQFIKLITGASFTEASVLNQIIHSYKETGITCVDMACDPELVKEAAEELKHTDIALMVSISLDDDPHFRKIILNRELCIDCSVCISACPTTVFSMPEATLEVDTPKCYGCNRCVPACPTEALSLEPFSTQHHWIETLSHPKVKAVEIHSEFVDASMVPDFWRELGEAVGDKIISLCFRPQNHNIEAVKDFIRAFQHRSPFPLIIQVDGAPMSATNDIRSSQVAIDAAVQFAEQLQDSYLSPFYLTISGGINQHTPTLLDTITESPIQGVGIGTAARRWIWPELEAKQTQQAKNRAQELITLFLEDKTTRVAKKGYNTHECEVY